jgi:hypothetical protein
MLANRDVLNCYLDLSRAATCFYLKPTGKNHLVFLKHGKKILKGINDRKAQGLYRRLTDIEKEVSIVVPSQKKRIINLADRILTLGILLKCAYASSRRSHQPN